MREINLIVIHCSASPNGESLFHGKFGDADFRTPVQVIDGWHAQRGFHRDPSWVERWNPKLPAIGYHYVIYTNGAEGTGRHVNEIGAHVAGHNSNSLGICMVGTDRFSAAQWISLRGLIDQLRKSYPTARICGHRDLSPDKDGDGIVEPWEWLKICPGFDVAAWLRGGMAAPRDHLCAEEAK